MTQQPAGWNQPCSDFHLAVIAKFISDWRTVATYLKITEPEVSAIIAESHHELGRKIAMLRKWKQKLGAKATYKRLSRAFDYCERVDLVDKVKQLLAESNSSSDEEGTITMLLYCITRSHDQSSIKSNCCVHCYYRCCNYWYYFKHATIAR